MASVRQLKTPNKEGKRPWVVEYTDAEGKRRRETPVTGLFKDAEVIRKRIERDEADGKLLATSRTITVARLCDLYAEHVEAKVRDGRIGRARAVQIDRHSRGIKAALGSRKLTELTRQHVEDFYNKCVGEDGLAPITAKNRVSTLRLMQDFAIKRNFMVKAPIAEAMKDLRGIVKPRVRTFSHDEIGLILSTAKTRRFRGTPRNTALTNCFVSLAAFCGMRFGEIVALKAENVDLRSRCIHVKHSFCQYTGLKAPKTKAGIRDIPLAPHLIAILRDWQENFHVPNSAGLLFSAVNGSPIKQPDFRNKMWIPLLERSGVEITDPPHFHALRHFAASWMIENGLPLTEVAKVMGHSTFDMTLQVYAHPVSTAARIRDAFDSMASRLLSAPPTIEVQPTL